MKLAEEYYKKVEDIGKRTIQEDGIYVSLEYCIQLMEDFSNEQNKELIEILKIAKCPDNCTDGAIAVTEGQEGFDNEWEPCQWCYERKKLIKNQSK